MPINIHEESDGKLLIVHVSGKLAASDYNQFAPEFERLVLKHGKLRVLFDMASFSGWGIGALWEDVKFDLKHSGDIERIAMVGDKKWEEGMATFCKPFTVAKIKYFDRADSVAARSWIGSNE
jgi:hypothetical protein